MSHDEKKPSNVTTTNQFPETMSLSEVRGALRNWRRNPLEGVRMPRYVSTDDGQHYWDTLCPVDAAQIRKMLKTEKMPSVADLDRAHRAQDKRMRRAEKLRLVTTE